jgi:hypothetical protein
MCTAIWSPSKSALNAVQTNGWILIALPSTGQVQSLNTQSVQSWSTVQQNRMLANNFLKNVPNDRFLTFDHRVLA